MLSDVDSLFNQVVAVLWELWGESILFQDSQDFVTSDTPNLWDTGSILKHYTNLRWGLSFSCHFEDLISDIACRNLYPAWWSSSVWQAPSGDTLTLSMHSSHFFYLIIKNDIFNIVSSKVGQ
jgi:hypothetical protein